MSDLVDFVLAQHGGAERWQGAETISAQVHAHGAFWPNKGQPDLLGCETVTADLTRQRISMSPFGKGQSLHFDAVVCPVQRSGRQRLVPPTSEDAATGTVTTVNQSPREATEYDLIVPAGAGGENVADQKALARGRDVDQEERRQCGRVDSRARAA